MKRRADSFLLKVESVDLQETAHLRRWSGADSNWKGTVGHHNHS